MKFNGCTGKWRLQKQLMNQVLNSSLRVTSHLPDFFTLGQEEVWGYQRSHISSPFELNLLSLRKIQCDAYMLSRYLFASINIS